MDIIRERLKEKRKNLTKKQSSELSRAIFLRIIRSSWIQEHSNIGIYYALNGEADTLKLIEFLWSNNQNAFLPVMHHNSLLFGNFAPNSDLNENTYGIPEPELTKENQVSALELDMVFVPLVAFDQDGYRLGMGGGYYDRAFEKKLKDQKSTTPLLIGLAYEFQKQNNLVHQPWDVPLDMVVTEANTYKFR
jgi:5-formyltetrahydrofolate cyclo-ligase